MFNCISHLTVLVVPLVRLHPSVHEVLAHHWVLVVQHFQEYLDFPARLAVPGVREGLVVRHCRENPESRPGLWHLSGHDHPRDPAGQVNLMEKLRHEHS